MSEWREAEAIKKWMETQDGRKELALALLLLRDFKDGGKFNVEASLQTLLMADHFGVRKEYDNLLTGLPPFKITERCPNGNN